MFTGLIEEVGSIAELKPLPTGFRLRVTSPLAAQLRVGESIAVNGVCLTVIAASNGEFYADVSPETARVTTLGGLKLGRAVNLERPLAADGRIGGHFVLGHVDATGSIEECRRDGDSYWVTVAFPQILAPYLVHKGSIAVDGISLTIAGLSERQFDVQIIPHTWEKTNLNGCKQGDAVNLECDVIGKYVVRVAELSEHQSHTRSRTHH
jgi:riboflavin synthase